MIQQFFFSFFFHRPSFQYFSWHTSFLGIVGCVVMMFLTNAIFASASIVVFLALFIYIYLRIPESDWGYITQALIFHQVICMYLYVYSKIKFGIHHTSIFHQVIYIYLYVYSRIRLGIYHANTDIFQVIYIYLIR